MINKALAPVELNAICGILADTNNGLSNSQIDNLLAQSQIVDVKNGTNKRNRLYNCFINEINTTNSYAKIYLFIQNALNPISYTGDSCRDQYDFLLNGVNKVLSLVGLTITKAGKIVVDEPVETLDEVDRRVSELYSKLHQRAIHDEVLKYCKKDFLRKDYYDTVFEASKGLAQRVRDITGLTTDGSKLYQEAFSGSEPWIVLNNLITDSEKSEHNGLRELLESTYHLIRNPAAHTVKINWWSNETEALDVLTVISFGHKYLDKCVKNPLKKY